MRTVRVAALVLAPVVAALLVALAVDVLRVPGRMDAGDLRLHSAPTRPGAEWDTEGILPWSAATRTLGTEDDVRYRRTVAVFARVQPGRIQVTGNQPLEALRAQAQLELTRASTAEGDRRRRSQLLNYVGTVMLDANALRNQADAEERARLLQTAIDSFRSAVVLDPSNGDAKYNLELALRLMVGTDVTGESPSGERAEGERSGAGRPGSGY